MITTITVTILSLVVILQAVAILSIKKEMNSFYTARETESRISTMSFRVENKAAAHTKRLLESTVYNERELRKRMKSFEIEERAKEELNDLWGETNENNIRF